MRAKIHVHGTVASKGEYSGLRIWQVVCAVLRPMIRLHISWPNCDPIVDDLIITVCLKSHVVKMDLRDQKRHGSHKPD